MIKKLLFVTIIYLLNSSALSGQCPDRALLWKRLVYLRDSSSSIPNGKQLSELSKYERDVKACPDEVDSTYAFLLLRIGVCYLRQADYYRAIEYIRRSIHMIDANVGRPSINDRYLAGYYYRLSMCYDSLHNIVEKIRAVDSCVAIAIRKNSVDQYAVYSLEKSVEYFKDIGDFARCVHYAKLGMVLAENYKHDLSSTEYYMIFLEREVEALIVLERFDEAEEIISPNLFSSRIEQLKKAGEWGYLATLYDHYAEVLTNKKDYEKALLWFGRSVSYDELNKNFLGCAITTENIGYHLYLHQLNDYDKAIGYYFKALQYAGRQLKSAGSIDELDIRIESLNILDNIANTFLAKGRYDSALFYFQKAFDQIKPGMNEMILLESSDSDFLSNKSIRYVLNMIIDKADATLQWGIRSGQLDQVGKAIIIYKTADKLLSRVRSEQTEITSKLFWRNDTRRLYDHAIEASYLTGNTHDAFYFFEKSRAVLLNDQLSQLSKITNGEILNQARIKKKILQLEIELNGTDHHSIRNDEIQTELFKEKQESDRLEQSIKHNNPVYYQNYMDTAFIGLPDVQEQILKDHQGLLEIFSGDRAIYSLLITAGQIYFDKIDKIDFDNTARSFEYYLSNISLLNSQYEDFIRTASHLYQLIFKNNPVPNGRIIVSPDAQFFPFEALVTNTKSGSPDYFLNHHALSYTYSARFLLTHFASGASGSPRNFLGVAPVRYPSGSYLADLSGSDFSLNRIVSYFGNSTTLVAAEASRSNFQQQFSKYEIIQLYTHASDSSSHDEPVIFFADSSLYLSDLIPENKPLTRLIVLSACETGLGKLNPGEGVFSFNRGFASLGIPSSITNLWSVDNESTYRITELFYKYLSAGEPIDMALQKAKIDFIQHSSRQNKLPYYWAAAILAGKSDAIEVGKMHLWKDILMIVVLMAISFFILKRWGKSKSQNM
jgi:CHAT domain-containing protein